VFSACPLNLLLVKPFIGKAHDLLPAFCIEDFQLICALEDFGELLFSNSVLASPSLAAESD